MEPSCSTPGGLTGKARGAGTVSALLPTVPESQGLGQQVLKKHYGAEEGRQGGPLPAWPEPDLLGQVSGKSRIPHVASVGIQADGCPILHMDKALPPPPDRSCCGQVRTQ